MNKQNLINHKHVFVFNDLIIGVLLGVAVFIKLITFHYCIYHSVLVSSIIHHTFIFWQFYFPKLVPCVIIMWLFMITHKKWWIIPVLAFIDIWCIANLTYYNANELFLNLDAIRMAENMEGFWSSLRLYITYQNMIFVFSTCIFCVIWYALTARKSHKRIKISSSLRWLSVIVPILFAITSNYFTHSTQITMSHIEYDTKTAWFNTANYLLNPFVDTQNNAQRIVQGKPTKNIEKEYIHKFSIISYSASVISLPLFCNYYKSHLPEYVNVEIISYKDKEEIKKFIGQNKKNQPTTNLIVILVESFESWTITPSNKIAGIEITPTINKLLKRSNILYANHIRSQVKHGVSGDGQMIVNTGLLPIYSGAACMLYGNNIYPNFGHFYPHSITVCQGLDTWNQKNVNTSYGIDSCYVNLTYEKQYSWIPDSIVFQDACSKFTSRRYPFYMQVITEATHSPFTTNYFKTLSLPHEMPKNMQNYLSCLHYTDSCLGNFIDTLEKYDYFRTGTLVITGDHTIFKQNMLSNFTEYAKTEDLSIKDGYNFTPLIIYSPSIEGNIQVTDTCYQMDIYPTIMHLIGCEDYYWKGFGVNLLDSAARHNRPITEQEAYRLSDLMIRSNYFETYLKQ